MHRQMNKILAVALLAIALLGTIASAQTGSGFDLTWHVIGGGGAGGPLTGSDFSLRSTTGQTAIGTFSDATYTFENGYWPGTVNTAPVLSGLPNVIVDETTSLPVTINLWAYAFDGQTPVDELTYAIEGAPPVGAGMSIVGNRWLTVHPSADWCGYADVVVRATDPFGLWDQDAFRVAVTWSCPGP